MIELFKSLTNREIASLIWVGIFLIFILLNKDVRKSLFQALLGMLGLKGTLFLAIAFIFINIIIVNLLLGKYDILKEIIVWCFIVPFPLLLGANKVKDDIHYFKKILKNSIKLMVIIAFIVNSYTFNIIAEIFLLLFILIFTMTSAYGEVKEEYKQVKVFSDYVLMILGIIMLTLAINGFINEPNKILAIKNLYVFFTPVILTVLFLPFIYFFSLIMEYESLIIRVKVFPDESFGKTKIFFHIFRLCNFNLYKLSNFYRFYMKRRTGGTEEYFLSVIDDYNRENK
ncbi:MAG: hypothetical protein QM490_01420 [Candidatus Gracilibacteria bacterium]